MMRVGSMIRQALVLMREKIPDLNISHVDVFLTVVLSENRLMPSEVAARTGLNAASITRLIKDLSLADLVEVVVDTNNMRMRRIRLLPAGIELGAAIDGLGSKPHA